MDWIAAPTQVCAQLDAMKRTIAELVSIVEARHQRARRCAQSANAAELAALLAEHVNASVEESVVLDQAELFGQRRHAALSALAQAVKDEHWRAYFDARVSLAAAPGSWAMTALGVCGKIRTLTDHIEAMIDWATKTDRHFHEQHAFAVQAHQRTAQAQRFSDAVASSCAGAREAVSSEQ